MVVTNISAHVLGLCLSLWAMPPFSKPLASLKNKNKVESIKVKLTTFRIKCFLHQNLESSVPGVFIYVQKNVNLSL